MNIMLPHEKEIKIKALINEAAEKLEAARELSVGLEHKNPTGWQSHERFYYDGPAYGMGGDLVNGEWQPSSGSC